MSKTSLLLGDCLQTLKTLPDNSVDSVVTDPPYGISFMAKHWDYDVPKVEVWREILRVLKPGGHLLAFFGTRTYHRGVVRIEDAGFEIRDQLAWIYGSGFPKSMDISKAIDKAAGAEREVVGESPNNRDRSKHTYNSVGNVGSQATITAPSTDEAKQWQGWGTALKPAQEPIVVARKPISEKTIAKNVLKHGTGALNIDASRIESHGPDINARKSKGATHVAEGVTFGHRGAGEWNSSQGRWPANVIFDEEAAKVLDEQSGVSKSAGGKGKKHTDGDLRMGATTGSGANVGGLGDSGGASRFFYVAKASKRERNAGLDGMPQKQVSHMITGSGKPSESVKERCADGEPNRFTATHQNHHPTVKPLKLMQYLIRMVTPPGGTCLDPFMGSGSTGCAAKQLGFNFIGCELSEQYMAIAEKRIAHYDSLKIEDESEVEEQLEFFNG